MDYNFKLRRLKNMWYSNFKIILGIGKVDVLVIFSWDHKNEAFKSTLKTKIFQCGPTRVETKSRFLCTETLRKQNEKFITFPPRFICRERGQFFHINACE